VSRAGDVVWWPTVEAALASLTVARLKQVGAVVSIGAGNRTKAKLAARIAAELDGEGLKALWGRLGELDRAAVAEAVHGSDGCFDAAQFRAKYGGDPDWGARDSWGSRSAASPLHLFIHDDVIPDDLLARLKSFVPPPAAASMRTCQDLPAAIERRVRAYDFATRRTAERSESVPLVVNDRESAAGAELAAVLRLIDAGKVGVSDKTRRPTTAAVRAVTSVLDGGDFYEDEAIGSIRGFAWPLLVQAGGLAERGGARLRLTPAGRRALGEPVAATLRRVWERWLGTRLLDELNRTSAIRGQTGKGKRGLTALAERRQTLAGALAELPLGRWIEVDELFRFMRAAGHDFDVTRDLWSLYVGDPRYGSLGYDEPGGWEILQGRYALCVLFEYAATLGVIDVAHVPPADARDDFRGPFSVEGLDFLSRYDGLSYVRLTPLGAYCLGITEDYVAPALESRPVLTVLASFEIVATQESVSAADRIMLDRYAEAVSDRAWRLTSERLLVALEAGGALGELGDFLAARSGNPVPTVVTQLLEDVRARAGAITNAGAACLIECADPALAALIANDPRTRKLCLLAGERHIVVPAKSVRAFRGALRKLGYPLAPLADQS